MNTSNKLILKTLIASLFLIFSSSFSIISSMFPQLERKIKANKKLLKEEIDIEINNIKKKVYEELIKELEGKTVWTWLSFKRRIDYERKIIKQCMQNAYQDATHDSRIPSFIYTELNEVTKKKDINLKSINIGHAVNSAKNRWAMDAYDGWLFLHKFCILPKINIYEEYIQKYQQYDETDRMFVIEHELWHIFLRHSKIITIANSYGNVKKLQSIVEKEADIHAASQNARLAHAAVKSRCFNGPHPHITDKDSHCEQLKYLYELMKQKEQLL
jgi:hypothetical protein